MAAEPAGVPIDELLAHARFVRGLTRSLVSDAHLAEDIEQETWTAAMENPPRAGVRAWFRAVARNLAANSFRAKERRGRRERGAARPEAEPATADLVARDAILREVLEAVLALDPLHREVVHLRFYEDLPPREIAVRLGVPVNTVRSRLLRAVALLRERLDRSHGGRRDAWVVGIAPMAGAEDGIPWGWIVGAKAKVAVAAAAFLLLGVGGWVLRGREEAAPPAPVETASAVPAAVELPAGGAPDSVMTVESPAASAPLPSPVEPETPAAPKPFEAFLEGVVVDADDRPVPGAEVSVFAPDPISSRYARTAAAADGEGRFRFTLLHPRGSVEASARGFAPSAPVPLDEAPGTTRAVRLVIPGAEGILEGVVLDTARNPIAGATVRVGPPDEMLSPALRAAGRSSPVVETDALGRFRVAGLAAGKIPVMALAPKHPPQFTGVEVSAGRTAAVEILLLPGVVVVGTVRDAEGNPVAGARVFAGDFTGARVGAKADAEGRFRIEAKSPGEMEIHVEEGRRGKVAATIDAPEGEETRCDLTLSIAEVIRGRVLDADGKPLSGWWVTGKPGRWFFPGQGAILDSPTDAEGAFLLQNLAPGTYEVLVRPERYGVPSLVRKGVGTGGSPLEIRVPAEALPSSGLRGVLKDGDGKPLQQGWMSLFPEIARDATVASVRPDPATGIFAKEHLPPGRYRVSLGSKAAGIRHLGVVELLPEKVLDMGDVVLDAPGTVRLVFPDAGERPPADQVSFSIEEEIGASAWFLPSRYALGPAGEAPEIFLGTGRYRLRLTGNFVAVVETTFTVRSGQETRLEVPLRRAPQRFLRIHGPAIPAEATLVHARVLDREGVNHQEVNFGRQPRKDDYLAYAFLLPGTYEWELTPEGGEAVRRTIVLGAEDGTDPRSPIDVELR